MGRSRFGLLDQVESISLEAKKRMVKKCNNEKASKAGNYPSDIRDFVYDPNNDPTILDDGEKQYAYGVLIDFTEGKSSPDLVRIGNMELHRTLPVQSQYKGCIWGYYEKKILYYLNPENWNLAVNDDVHNVQKTAAQVKADMENANYGIRIETPKFYASSKILATDSVGHTIMAKVMFSTVKLNASYIEIPKQVTDFRNCRVNGTDFADGLVCNINADGDVGGGYNMSGYHMYPVTGFDRHDARIYAHITNSHLMCYEYYKWLFYWAFVIEYATLNSHKPVINELDENGFHQGGLGGGLTLIVEDNGVNLEDTTGKDKCRYIGVTNELGNGTGELNIPTDTNLDKVGHPNRYRGFECPFGDVKIILDGFLGVQIVNYEGDGVFYDYYSCCNPEYFADDIPLPWNAGNTEINDKWTKIARYQDFNTNEFYDTEEGDGLHMGYITKYMSIGNRGELLPQMWQTEDGKYFVDYSQVNDKNNGSKTIMIAGSAVNNYSYCDIEANNDTSFKLDNSGFRCFNIIKDDGTVI